MAALLGGRINAIICLYHSNLYPPQQKVLAAPNFKKQFLSRSEVPPVRPGYTGSGKLNDKVAIITGGDSGIGRSVALYFAREGADVAIAYLESDTDARKNRALVISEGKKCLLIKGDLSTEAFCKKVAVATVKEYEKIDILVNNAGMHIDDDSLASITSLSLSHLR